MKGYLFIVAIIVSYISVNAQTILTPQDAIALAIENNYDIQIARNLTDRAKNNTSRDNSGKKPTVGINANYTYRSDNTTANFQDGRSTSLSFASSQAANASIGVGYILYNGGFRDARIEQLAESYQLSKLELQATMENVAAQTLQQYYQVAALQENMNILSEAIEVSTARIERIEQEIAYGQSSGLAALNAMVDLNNDSLAYMTAQIQLDNAKRQLNNLMLSPLDYEIEVETDQEFLVGLDRDMLRDQMYAQNLQISAAEKNIEIGSISIDLLNARKLPTLRADVSYGVAYNKNNPASFLASLNNNGLNAGLTLTWDLYDGGQTRYALEDAKIANMGLELQRAQLLQDLDLQFEVAWANYTDRKEIHRSQERNVHISEANFQRTEEQYNIGQITTVEYRQAQLNLLNDRLATTSARFQVKIAEVELLLLSGLILD